MPYSFNALIVDSRSDAVRKLSDALLPDIQFAAADRTASLTDAFQKLVDTPDYNLAFVHSGFAKDLDAFFTDMQRLGRDKTCIFVQVWDKIPEKFDKSRWTKLGFSAVIEYNISTQDRNLLRDLLGAEFHKQEIGRRIQDVTASLEVMMKHIDKAAEDRKRGRKTKTPDVASGFVKILTEYDEEVLLEYFDEVVEKTAEAPAFEKTVLSVPRDILEKKLPGLKESGYSGVSYKVWRKMLAKYGITEEEAKRLENERKQRKKV